MADRSAALGAVSDALLGIAGDLRTEAVLEQLVEAARSLAGARYAALGVPDDEGTGFRRWLSAGLTDAEIEAIGPLPRTHGVLGAALADPQPFRSHDVRADERFGGWWPPAHPELDTFLAVPIELRGEVVAAFYLSNREGGFGPEEEALVGELAAHAAVLIEHARLHDDRRELAVLEERNRLARDLHDAVTQSLFGLRLRLESGDVVGAAALLDDVFDELRSLIGQLRPPALETEGLVTTLAKHLDVAGRTHGVRTRLDADGVVTLDPRVEAELFRIAQEAITNAVRHGRPTEVAVRLASAGDHVALEVRDDGSGFEVDVPRTSARHLGLTTMRERAADVGGQLTVVSTPGEGTVVRAEVPAG